MLMGIHNIKKNPIFFFKNPGTVAARQVLALWALDWVWHRAKIKLRCASYCD